MYHDDIIPYLRDGNPDLTNLATLYKQGELGMRFSAKGGKSRYHRVKLDSGATASTPIGAVAANQLAYWKDKATYLVTNDRRFAMNTTLANNGYRNYVAGVFRIAATAGYYTDILTRGTSIPVADGGNTFVAGDVAVGEADAAAAVDSVNAGTAPTCIPVGIARGAASGGNVNLDVDLPEVE